MSLDSLSPAPYNPRTITAEARAGLLECLRRFGDLSGVVLNRRTGHLVGAHQRVEAFRSDAGARVEITERLSEPDRVGTVAWGFVIALGTRYSYREVDWDELREKQANLAANNPAIAGAFTVGMLPIPEEIRAGDPGAMGALRLEELLSEMIPVGLTRDQVGEESPKLAEFKRQRAESRKRGQDLHENNFWLCVVFDSWDQKREFIERTGIATRYGMYVIGEHVAKLCGVELRTPTGKPLRITVDKELAARVLRSERNAGADSEKPER